MRNLLMLFRDNPFVTLGLAALITVAVPKWRREAPAGLWLAWAGLLSVVAACAGYLYLPGFAYSSEIAVASVAWNAQLGQPVYHALDAPRVSNLHYGPWLFLIEGWSLRLLGPSYFAAKFPAVLAALGALGLCWAQLRKEAGSSSAWVLTGLAAWVYWRFDSVALVARGDVFILFGSALAYWAASQRSHWLSGILLGAALALLNGVKIHAALFALPALLILWRSHGGLALALAGLVAGSLAALPFVGLGVDLGAYLDELKLLSHHGLEAATFWAIAVDLAWLSLPALAWAWKGSGNEGSRGLWISLGPLVLGALVLGSKPGSGSFHLLGLLIPGLLVLGTAAGRWERWPALFKRAVWVLLCSATATGLASAALNGRAVVKRTYNPAVAEMAALRQALPGVALAMGCRGDSYSSHAEYWANIYTWQRIQLTFDGMLQPFEEFAQRDLAYADRPFPKALTTQILAGKPDLWLLPRVEGKAPFEAIQLYDRGPMFADLQAGFPLYFRKVWTGACFELWAHKRRILSTAEKAALDKLPQPKEALYPPAWSH